MHSKTNMQCKQCKKLKTNVNTYQKQQQINLSIVTFNNVNPQRRRRNKFNHVQRGYLCGAEFERKETWYRHIVL